MVKILDDVVRFPKMNSTVSVFKEQWTSWGEWITLPIQMLFTHNCKQMSASPGNPSLDNFHFLLVKTIFI